MFFVNGVDKGKKKTKSLKDVIDAESIVVAYGVFSLKKYLELVKSEESDYYQVLIPKVQRGVVWDDVKRNKFINQCISGESAELKPMPSFFLFYDTSTKELQLLDGLQRTTAILEYFENREVLNDIMIPAAFFKGTRKKAEEFFKDVNTQGVTLNSFELLASSGWNYEIDLNSKELTGKFKGEFKNFISESNSAYIKYGFETTSEEKSTIYELIKFAIWKMKKSTYFNIIFPNVKKNDEIAFQIVYSILLHENDKSAKMAYTSKKMTDKLNEYAANYFSYKKPGYFNENNLYKFIDNLIDAITNTHIVLRKLININVNSKNNNKTNNIVGSSSTIVSAIVVYNYFEKIKDTINQSHYTKLLHWYIYTVLSGRASKMTNHIVDELFKNDGVISADNTLLIDNKIAKYVDENSNASNHNNHLMALMWIYWDVITKKSETDFQIDHIVPQSKLIQLGVKKDYSNHIANLELLESKVNNNKSDKFLYECSDFNDDWLTELLFSKSESYEWVISNSKSLKFSFDNNDAINFKANYDEFILERTKWIVEKFGKNDKTLVLSTY